MHPALYEYIIEIKQDSAPNAYEKRKNWVKYR